MTNKELLINAVSNIKDSVKYIIGDIDPRILKLSKSELNKIISVIDQEYMDIDVYINGKLYIVELTTVDGEKDLGILTKEEYISRYGEDRWLNLDVKESPIKETKKETKTTPKEKKENKPSYKYTVKCNHCGEEFNYKNKSKTIKDLLADPNADVYCSCGKTGCFNVIEN